MAKNLDGMSAAELEAHSYELGAKADELRAERRAVREALDRAILEEQAKARLGAMTIGEVEVIAKMATAEASARATATTGGDD